MLMLFNVLFKIQERTERKQQIVDIQRNLINMPVNDFSLISLL